MSSTSILVVDDSPSLRGMIAACLRAAGHSVTEASDGAQACALASGTDFSLVVTDLVMPGIDGLGLIRALRGNPRHASLPILVLSTEADDAVRTRAREAGASGFLGKPFDPEELLLAVGALMDPTDVG